MGRSVREKINDADRAHLEWVVAQLVTRRIDLQMTQHTLAKLMETTQSAVSEMENLRVYPATTTVLRWARALGLAARIELT